LLSITQRVLDELCGPVTVVGVDCLFQEIDHLRKLLALDRDVQVQELLL
jgi:hypothetical protein